MVEIHSSGGGPREPQHEYGGDSNHQYEDQSEVDIQQERTPGSSSNQGYRSNQQPNERYAVSSAPRSGIQPYQDHQNQGSAITS